MFDQFKQLGELKKMRDQAMQIQKQLAQEKVEVEKNNIKIVIRGDQRIESIEIDGEENRDLVEAVNDAVKKSQEVAAKKMQQMGGLDGLKGLLG